MVDELPRVLAVGRAVHAPWVDRAGAGARATRLVGEYQPTAKNEAVAGLYPKLGFAAGDGAYFTRDLGASANNLVTHIAPA